MPTMREDLFDLLLRLISPREAAAQVLAGDPTAAPLLDRMRTGLLPPDLC